MRSEYHRTASCIRSGAIMKSRTVAPLLAAVLSAIIATAAFGQAGTPRVVAPANDTGRMLVLSKTLQLSADTERSGIVVPAKTFFLPYPGQVRIRWQVKSDGSGNPATVTAGGQLGACSSSNSTAAYRTGVCELRVVAGDILQVTAHG